MAYQLIWENNGVLAYFKDRLNDQELREIVAVFYGHEQFDSIKYLLINLLDIEIFNVSEETLRHIGAMDYAASFSNPNIKVAIAVNNISFLDRLSSYEKVTQKSPWPLGYFDNIEEARAWATRQ